MRYSIRYVHPVTGNFYYFIRFKDDGRPVGCMPYTYRRKGARVFPSVKAAFLVGKKIASMGYRVRFCRCIVSK